MRYQCLGVYFVFVLLCTDVQGLSLEEDEGYAAMMAVVNRDREDFRHVVEILAHPEKLDRKVAKKPLLGKKYVVDETKNLSEDEKLKQMLASGQALSKAQMPMMLGFLSDMYERMKVNIRSANLSEKKSKESYEKHMDEVKNWPKSFKKDKAMMRMAEYWSTSRNLSKKHYRSMLKMTHAGMARIKQTMDMLDRAIKGEDLTRSQKRELNVAPEIVLLGIHHTIKACYEVWQNLPRFS